MGCIGTARLYRNHQWASGETSGRIRRELKQIALYRIGALAESCGRRLSELRRKCWKWRLPALVAMRGPHLKISDFTPGEFSEAVRMVGAGIDDRLAAGHDICDQVTGARTDTEAVPAEAGGEDETRYCSDFAYARHSVRRAIDIACPGGGDPGVLQSRQ